MYYTESDGSPHAAQKFVRTVDGQEVTTWTREILDCCCLEVEAGTNGYKGGDAGHGSRVYLRIFDMGDTSFCSKVDHMDLDDRKDEYVFALGGDAELSAVKEALRWMLSVLEAQSE